MKLKLFLLIITTSITLMGCVDNRYPIDEKEDSKQEQVEDGAENKEEDNEDKEDKEDDLLLKDNLDRVNEVLDELEEFGVQ